MKWFKGLRKTHNDTVIENDNIIEKTTIYYIPCDKIRSNAMRSRSDFNEDKLVSLAYSIKKYGILEPLCVRHTEYDDSYDYEIIMGERRLRAARLLELSSVPCIIIDVPPEISAEMSLSENIFHVQLDYFEEAFALKRLCDIYEDSENLAARLSMSNNELVRKLRLLELDFAERQAILNLNISEDNAVELSRISDKNVRSKIIKYIETEKLGNFATAKYISKIKYSYDDNIDNIPDTAVNSKENIIISPDTSSAILEIDKELAFINHNDTCAKMSVEKNMNEIKITITISS